MSEFVTSPVLSKVLGVSERQVRNLVEKGVLSAMKDGKGHYQFDIETAIREYGEYDHIKPVERRERMVKASAYELAWDIVLKDSWITRSVLLDFPKRLIARISNESNVESSDLEAIQSAIEDEVCECLALIENEDYERHSQALRLMRDCPKNAMPPDSSNQTCPNNGRCFDVSSFSLCIASSCPPDMSSPVSREDCTQ